MQMARFGGFENNILQNVDVKKKNPIFFNFLHKEFEFLEEKGTY